MHLGGFTPGRSRALLLGGAVLTLAAAAAPVTGAASTRTPVSRALSHIHAMPTLQHERAGDCTLFVSVCQGAGTPMSTANGPIQVAPAVYIVFWGWNGIDPAGMGARQQNFFNGVGGSAWNASQTQYCKTANAPLNTTCPSNGTFVGNPTGVLKGTWTDNTNAVPASPDDNAIQAEAVRAAAHFANTTSASNAGTQYVIDTPHGNSTTGFGTQWCAYHGIASSSYGGLAYTDFPYIPDAGQSCGQNFVNAGSAGTLDGVSIVGGHEFAETETDPAVANTGWTDSIGAETGDKCAWISAGPGASTNVSLSNGTYAVQSLWSNNANSGAGGCVVFYAGAGNQH
ncbi:MAG TPA: hypothetical protein VGQ42_11855 [Candidatus Dormibacteraeota bacterium]|nr:hypothetical protein [Candidatus Dormibacteraeota bacterium]